MPISGITGPGGPASSASSQWQNLLLERDSDIAALIRSSKRIAVLGIKPDNVPSEPANFVPSYLLQVGFEVVPVPTRYPGVSRILNIAVERDLTKVSGPVDIVNVFRRPADIDAHVDDIIALAPRAVWFQTGIRNDQAAARLAQAGIAVVQNRCLKVEHMRLRA